VRQAYRGAHRSEGNEEEEEKKYEVEEVERKMDDYIRIVHRNTEFFSTYDPKVLFDVLQQYAEESGCQVELAKDKYKAKLQILMEEGAVEMNVKVMRVPEVDGKICVEFSKCSGTDSIKFFEKFNNVKEYFGEFINATY
jgi:hypothetical protein